MSNYNEEDTNSDIQEENSGYDSEEGSYLGISTLDYEKIDLEYQRGKDNNKSNNKRLLEEQYSDDTSHKKTKLNFSNENLPIKKESTSEGNDNDNNEEEEKDDDDLITCPICLEYYSNKTLLNPCYHAFCYECIKFWSKVSQNCPLCKQTFNFAIYNIKDEYNFDKIYFGEDGSTNQKQKKQNVSSSRNRSNSIYSFPNSSSSSNTKPSDTKEDIERRRNIYINGLYAKQMEKYKVLKENQTYLDYLSKNKVKFNRIIPWIERDLKAILPIDDIELIRDYIINIIKKNDLDSEKATTEISKFLDKNTNHFIYELKGFINSPFNISTYDRLTQYEKKSDHKIPLEVTKKYFITQSKIKKKNKGKEEE